LPTVLRIDGFRFFFYSNEGDEPAHIHITSGEAEAKFWLDPISLASNNGFNAPTINKLTAHVRNHQMLLLAKWNEFFRPAADDAILGESQ